MIDVEFEKSEQNAPLFHKSIYFLSIIYRGHMMMYWKRVDQFKHEKSEQNALFHKSIYFLSIIYRGHMMMYWKCVDQFKHGN
jgi:hypothetical protein